MYVRYSDSVAAALWSFVKMAVGTSTASSRWFRLLNTPYLQGFTGGDRAFISSIDVPVISNVPVLKEEKLQQLGSQNLR